MQREEVLISAATTPQHAMQQSGSPLPQEAGTDESVAAQSPTAVHTAVVGTRTAVVLRGLVALTGSNRCSCPDQVTGSHPRDVMRSQIQKCEPCRSHRQPVAGISVVQAGIAPRRSPMAARRAHVRMTGAFWCCLLAACYVAGASALATGYVRPGSLAVFGDNIRVRAARERLCPKCIVLELRKRAGSCFTCNRVVVTTPRSATAVA